MILPSARRAELEVRRDDDKCNSLRSTENRHGLLCPNLLEDHDCRVDPASRWIFLFHLRLGIRSFHHRRLKFPLHCVLEHGFLTRPRFPEFSANKTYPRKNCPERNDLAFEWFSKSPFIECFSICQEVWDIPQITVAFHTANPSFFIQTRLQQHRRRTFFHSAYRSFSNTFVSDRWGADVQSLHDCSSQALPNSKELSV